MAKARKRKSGLHKNISSVLKGVPIPQGVRNWRPADKFGPDRIGNSSAVLESKISSVFKGARASAGYGERPPSGRPRQDDCAEVYGFETSDEGCSAPRNLTRQLDSTDEFSLGSAGRVAYYRDPLLEAVAPTVGQRILNKLFGRKRRMGG